ncbi:MAG: threonine synthase [Gammaproteobacteria bacterium]|nr:threonine synthase [Gammaproteobacteria bacterium]
MPINYTGLIDHYRAWMPLADDIEVISLREGNTPLMRLHNMESELNADVRLYAKYEGTNPTGSFKDRGMTVAVTQARYEGAEAIICASTGNTSASAAAYAARGGMRAFVIIPEGKIAFGKLAQAVMHGAKVIQIRGNFDDGMRLVKEMAESAPVALVNSVNPFRLHGQKTAAFEIVDVLGRAPDFHCLPVGNAGNISAYWMGYCEYVGAERANTRPAMVGCQASGAAPFVHGAPVRTPETVATAIRIGQPQSWDKALVAGQESKGWFCAFDDREILRCQRLLAEREGVFCEPASAISVAGAIDAVVKGRIPAGATVVCTVTGHGLKDADTAVTENALRPLQVPAEAGAVRQAILDAL